MRAFCPLPPALLYKACVDLTLFGGDVSPIGSPDTMHFID